MRSGSLGGEQRWPRFGPRAGRLGVHSVLSLPLLTPDGVFGAMNVYAHGKDAFDEQAARIAKEDGEQHDQDEKPGRELRARRRARRTQDAGFPPPPPHDH